LKRSRKHLTLAIPPALLLFPLKPKARKQSKRLTSSRNTSRLLKRCLRCVGARLCGFHPLLL
ncbi:hypothetical protein ACHAXM_000391, partial [Skeletonema potamos]